MKDFKFLFALMSLIWFTDAYAYLDPGTGSLIIQSTIAAVTGGLFVLKTYWHKLKSLFCRKQNTAEEEKSQSPESPHNH